MKTAEEWFKNQPSEEINERGGDTYVEYDVTPNWIKQIQLDAMKEGMRRAADCAISDALMHHHDAEGRCNCGNCSARRAILTASDQLTKKDL